MAVALDQPRDGQLPAQVDDLRGGTHERLDGLVGADGDDAIAADSDCLRFGHRGVNGDDLAVAQHERGRRGWILPGDDHGRQHQDRR